MRLISQCREKDLPYDNTVLNISTLNDREIIAWQFGCPDEVVSLGEYSSKDKALKVMEMLREQYQKGEVAKTVSCGIANAWQKK